MQGNIKEGTISMGGLREIITNYNVEILLGLIIAFFALLVLYVIAQFRVKNITEKYNKLVKGIEGPNLEELLLKSLNELGELKLNVEDVEKKIDILNNKLKGAVQKIGMVRYDAFADMGSELSYSIAFLDDRLNGLVITSIYGRDFSTTYAKPIEKGESKYPLSAEEMQAIDRAAGERSYAEML